MTAIFFFQSLPLLPYASCVFWVHPLILFIFLLLFFFLTLLLLFFQQFSYIFCYSSSHYSSPYHYYSFHFFTLFLHIFLSISLYCYSSFDSFISFLALFLPIILHLTVTIFPTFPLIFYFSSPIFFSIILVLLPLLSSIQSMFYLQKNVITLLLSLKFFFLIISCNLALSLWVFVFFDSSILGWCVLVLCFLIPILCFFSLLWFYIIENYEVLKYLFG